MKRRRVRRSTRAARRSFEDGDKLWLAHTQGGHTARPCGEAMRRGHGAGPCGEAKQRDQTAETRRQGKMEKPHGEAITEAKL
jgi:hypothetical protein